MLLPGVRSHFLFSSLQKGTEQLRMGMSINVYWSPPDKAASPNRQGRAAPNAPGTLISARQPKAFMLAWDVQAEVIFVVHWDSRNT